LVLYGLVCVAHGLEITNELTIKCDKNYYSAFEHITCTISGLSTVAQKPNDKDMLVGTAFNNSFINVFSPTEYGCDGYYWRKRNLIRIVKSSSLATSSDDYSQLIDLKDSGGESVYFSYISEDYDSVNVTTQINYESIIGPVFDNRLMGDDTRSSYIDNNYTNISVMNTSLTAGPYQLIVYYESEYVPPGIHGTSQPFMIGPSTPVSMIVNKSTYYAGENFNFSIFEQNKTVFKDTHRGDYIRVYKVPYDVSSNPQMLNKENGTTAYISSLNYKTSGILPEIYSVIENTIDWKTPGMYQLVLFSEYGQLIRGISNVFQIVPFKRNKNMTVTVMNGTTGIYPGQSLQVNIYMDNALPVYGVQIGTAFIPAKDNVNMYLNGTFPWIAMSQHFPVWDPKNKNNLTTSTARFNSLKPGWYKVVAFVGTIGTNVIAVSKQVLVKRPYVQISLPKRTFSQWEPLFVTVQDIISR
jgi:hypothetical protein